MLSALDKAICVPPLRIDLESRTKPNWCWAASSGSSRCEKNGETTGKHVFLGGRGAKKATRTTDDSKPLQFGLSGFICRTEQFAEKIWQPLTYLSYSFVIYLLAADSFTGMTWNYTLLGSCGDLSQHSDELQPQTVSILSTQQSWICVRWTRRDVSQAPLMIALMAQPRKSIIPNGSERRDSRAPRSSVAFIRAITPRSQLIGGRLVHFNKANELPVTIVIQHSLPGILFI